MAQLTGPLMSLKASGTIAKTLVYSRWKGIDYARTRVIPANPQSVSQTQTRTVFTFLQDLYKRMPSIAREPWIASAVGNPFTPTNQFLSKNVAPLREEIDLANLVFSPGALGGSPPTGIVTTPGSGQLSVAVSTPTPPTGWTLTAAQGMVVRDQDPHLAIVEAPHAIEDLTSTYTLVFTGLTSGEDYRIGVWLKWLTSTGNIAYSVAVNDLDTPT